MTIDDAFYARIGRMTVAFGSLDFFVDYLAVNMAQRLGVEEKLSPFTARKLEAIKSWAREHENRLGKETADELVDVAGEVKGFLRRRQDAVHGLWLQEGNDADAVWSMKIPKGGTTGRPSQTDGATVDELTEQAKALQQRVGLVTVQVLKV